MSGKQKDGPEAVDVHVGGEIRARRTRLGMNQTELGRELGVTFQQVQKYENGANRVSASVLFKCARALGCTPADFFPQADAAPNVRPTITSAPGGLKLETIYLDLPPKQRQALIMVAEALAESVV